MALRVRRRVDQPVTHPSGFTGMDVGPNGQNRELLCCKIKRVIKNRDQSRHYGLEDQTTTLGVSVRGRT